MNLASRLALASVALVALVAWERTASACGGCFHEPPKTDKPTVVTDHRMLFSVGQGQSTLYDQIRYQGTPEQFAWILPITAEVEVGLSSDALFGTIDAVTQTSVLEPPMNCPTRPSGCRSSGGCSSSEATAAFDSEGKAGGAPQVTVTKREVVGPYETVQIQSKDPQALTTWLKDNGFVLTEEVRPVVEQYVRENFNFLALKLRPGSSVQSMRPVRVTSKGPSVVLPLRMVAAGTGATVGITLWVTAQGRYEPKNFPIYGIANSDLVWRWKEGASNYKEVRAAKAAAAGGRAWELESYTALDASVFGFALDDAERDPQTGRSTVSVDYPQQQGKTSEQLRDEDQRIAVGTAQGSFRVTRLRADLPKAALSEDLVLSASADQSIIALQRRPAKEEGEPLCPVWDGCETNGTAPRSEAITRSSGSCSTAGGASEHGALLAGLGFAALAMVRARARRR